MKLRVLGRRLAPGATAAVLVSLTILVSPSAIAQAYLNAAAPTAPPRGAFALCAEDRQTCGLDSASADDESRPANASEVATGPEKSDGSKASPGLDHSIDHEAFNAPAAMSDEQVMAMAHVINARINATMRYQTDQAVWGVEERWVRPLAQFQTRFGDCEDFALEKRAALLEAGVPAGRLRMAVGWSRSTGIHAVLIVRTEQGDFVLDNATTDIRRVDEAGYEWRSVQSGPHLLAWSSVTLETPQTATTS